MLLTYALCFSVPIILDTGIHATCSAWNHNGSILAVTGSMLLPEDDKEANIIQFFTPFGEVSNFCFVKERVLNLGLQNNWIFCLVTLLNSTYGCPRRWWS